MESTQMANPVEPYPKSDTVAFGSAVKSRRKELGISQEELAERAGLHRTYVCDVERGARNLSLHSIVRIAAALKIAPAALFGGFEGVSLSN